MGQEQGVGRAEADERRFKGMSLKHAIVTTYVTGITKSQINPTNTAPCGELSTHRHNLFGPQAYNTFVRQTR